MLCDGFFFKCETSSGRRRRRDEGKEKKGKEDRIGQVCMPRATGEPALGREFQGRRKEAERAEIVSRVTPESRPSVRPSVQTAGAETDRVVISFVDHHGQAQVYYVLCNNNGHVPPPKLQYTSTVTHDTSTRRYSQCSSAFVTTQHLVQHGRCCSHDMTQRNMTFEN